MRRFHGSGADGSRRCQLTSTAQQRRVALVTQILL
jgi:hypothetical protein